MSNITKIDGRELSRLLQGSALHEDVKKLKSKIRESIVAHIDEKVEVLSAISAMRRKIEDKLMEEMLLARSSPAKLAELLVIKGIRAPGVNDAMIRERFLLAPPSAIREVAAKFADEVIEDAYREAQTIVGRY